MRDQSPKRALAGAAMLGAITLVAGLASCGGSGGAGSGDALILPTFAAPIPLTAADVDVIVRRAAESVDSPNLVIAVVDRIGDVLAVFARNPAASVDDQNRAVSVARTGAFMSSSQGPISSRTLEFISTSHFPATFGSPEPLPNPFGFDFSKLAQQRPTTGVANTPQGPLWQIFTSNRGAPLAGPGLTTAETGVETLYLPGQDIPHAAKIDGSSPGPGLTYLAGGIPLYDRGGSGGRLVGGVGVVGASPETCEFAAISGATGTGAVGDPNFFFAAPGQGAIFLVGVLLPYFAQSDRPAGVGPGVFPGAGVYTVDPFGFGVFPARVDPHGYLIGPRDDPLGNLTAAQVDTIIQQGVATANGTRAAIRLPIGSACKMIFVVTNNDGLILGAFRMEDAPIFSLDVAAAKARTMTYYAGPNLDPQDAIPGLPPGTAVTTRTLGFVTQPFYPPGIEGTAPGPLFASVAQFNQNPTQFNRMGRAPFRAGLQSGMIFFPGATALYNAGGQLLGGLGVSGDGVEQDDFVTAGASIGFEAPPAIRADQFSFGGVALPYYKFPQLPGPGN
jgi:uncharacterized protein GlcG (DUF336 family)